MNPFSDRYLPRGERRTALWLALGGAAVGWAAIEAAWRVESVADDSMAGAGSATWGPPLVAALVVFASVALTVAVLVRFARAPRALALYLALGSVVSALGAIGDSRAVIAAAVGVGTGAVAGAWIAATVSLARIRDDGFSGNQAGDGGLSRLPVRRGLTFLGWEGRPAVGDALVAVAFAAAMVIPAIVSSVLSSGMDVVMLNTAGEFAQGSLYAFQIAHLAGSGLAWFASVYLVTRRSGVRSTWLGSASALPPLATGIVWLLSAPIDVTLLVDNALGIADIVIVPSAALAGAALAIGREPATLGSDDSQDPDAPDASTDTAGGDDD